MKIQIFFSKSKMLRVFRSISRHLKPKVEHARCYSIELQSKTTSLLENNEKRRKMIELEVDVSILMIIFLLIQADRSYSLHYLLDNETRRKKSAEWTVKH